MPQAHIIPILFYQLKSVLKTRLGLKICAKGKIGEENSLLRATYPTLVSCNVNMCCSVTLQGKFYSSCDGDLYGCLRDLSIWVFLLVWGWFIDVFLESSLMMTNVTSSYSVNFLLFLVYSSLCQVQHSLVSSCYFIHIIFSRV